jgi:hypothetical protein
MKITLKYLAILPLAALMLATLGGCSCGFDCNNDRDDNPTSLTLGLSDQDFEDLKQVVIEVDRITFRRTGVDDVVVDTFTIDQLDLVDVDSFQIDLLDYQGLNQLLVIEDLELRSGSYSALNITILGNDINNSYVQESDDTIRAITVSGGALSLAGPDFPRGNQVFTVEFSLPQALQYQESAGSYRLTTDGVRVMDNATAASLAGRVDTSLFDTAAPCDAKTDPESGNRIYLYADSGIDADNLADVYTSASATDVPANKRAPYAVASLARDTLTGGWQYSFGYIDAGDYTMAFSCNAAADDPVNYDGITIPLPDDQLYNIRLDEGERAVCDLAPDASCS